MSLAKLPRAVRDYLTSFNCIAVCVLPGGKVVARRDPTGSAAAWWCPSAFATHLVREANTRTRGDVPAAAIRLGVTLTKHRDAVARARVAIARLEDGISKSQNAGHLQHFNRAYRARREAAQAAGSNFMTYAQARARLTRELFRVAAGEASEKLIAKVFADR